MPKKLMVFDLDGTLVDSGQVVAFILNQLRQEMGKEAKDIDFFIPWLSLGGEDLVANGLELSVNEISPYLKEFRSRYSQLSTPLNSVYEGVAQLLDFLNVRNVKMCVCTNKPRALAQKVLRETGLEKYFMYMCAGGDLKTKKPSPENLEICLKYFGEDPLNVLLIGDSKIDQKIADSLDVDFAFFKGGYNDGVEVADVTYSFDHHIDLKNYLKGDMYE